MKNYNYLILGLGLLCMVPAQPLLAAERAVSDATTETALDYKKEKTIERSLRINAGQRLDLKNSYGKVRLINWDRNEVKVTIRVRVEEQSEQRAINALERVEILESNTASAIGFETRINQEKESWWSSLTNTGKRSLNIDYEVYLPKSNEINIKNNYGTTEIPDRSGKVSLSVGYGTLKAGRFQGSSNKITVSYSKADIIYVEKGDIDVKYSKFELGSGQDLDLSLKYSGGSIIGEVNGTLTASLGYSGTKIAFGKNLSRADIKASYSGVEIRPDAQAGFDFDVSTSYGGFDYNKSKTKLSEQHKESHTSNSYAGTYQGGGATVKIRSSYGGVTLK